MNLCSPSLFWGVGIFSMSLIFPGSGFMPLSVYRLPKNEIQFCFTVHLSLLNIIPVSAAHSISLIRFVVSFIFSTYSYVISYTDHTVKALEDLVHLGLEEILGNAQSKWQTFPAVSTKWSVKCWQDLQVFIEMYGPVSCFCVKFAEDLCTCKILDSAPPL